MAAKDAEADEKNTTIVQVCMIVRHMKFFCRVGGNVGCVVSHMLSTPCGSRAVSNWVSV